ncbi:MAG: SMR family transporter [Bifidobacterium pseudolongum]|nr:SMR family transporter [Bifidobacterium pseudolongum]
MAWVVLVLFGICEAVWAVALDKSQGFTKTIPVIMFFCGLAASMAGLSYAMRSISVGTAYLIWVGIGAAITVVYGMVVGEESVSVLKILCLIGMAACIAGLKLAG